MALYNQRRGTLADTGLPPTFPDVGTAINPSIIDAIGSDDNNYDVDMRMNQLYKPETSASEYFNSLLRNYPQRTDPTKLQKIGFMLAGMSDLGHPERSKEALDLQQRMTEGPFADQLTDWLNQIKPAEQAASVERLGNQNLRQQANQIISQELSEKRLQRQISADKTRERQGDERLSQSNQRLSLAEKRLEIARAVANGGTIKMDKATGQGKIIYRDGTSKDVDLNEIPQEDLLELEQRNALERIDRTAEQRAANPSSRDRVQTQVVEDPRPGHEGKKVIAIVNLDKKRPDGTNEVTYAELPGGAAAVPTVRNSETENSKQVDATAKQARTAHPEWGNWIKIDKNGKFVDLVKPSRWFPGTPDEATYKQMYAAVYGKRAPALPPETPPTSTTQITIPKGKVRVRRKEDGKTGLMDENDPALKSGKYEVISAR